MLELMIKALNRTTPDVQVAILFRRHLWPDSSGRSLTMHDRWESPEEHPGHETRQSESPQGSFINCLSADVTGSLEAASAGPPGSLNRRQPSTSRRCRNLRPCLESHFRASRVITAKRIKWPECAF